MEEVRVALLTSVPLRHLEAALEVQQRYGKVAFGSEAWDTLAELQALLKDRTTDVLIYASRTLPVNFAATWRGKFLGHKLANQITGTHPEGMKYRPTTTAGEKWAAYWEVSELRKLPRGEWIPIHDFSGYGSKARYRKTFVPRGPLIVESM
jgi:hypothetical protein